ncbi:MAG TPA: SpoIID/LytB domain-containing protein [Bacteroidales bacterium]|nr:SpoIID/LytB domain-containing protein [Bacteroidales bacterium]
MKLRLELLVFLFAVLFPVVSPAQMIRIGLYSNEVVKSLVVSCTSGEYLIKHGEERIDNFNKGDILYASLTPQGISLHSESQQYGVFSTIELNSLSMNGTFRIRSVVPSLKSRSYDDGLILEARSAYINVINEVDFDKYIAGVLETEVGPNAEKELYKAHALLTRTYMFNNYNKHREEGFSLCDGTHCQAYYGRSTLNDDIKGAIFETSGEVVADYHYKLITAVFHANSGGETQRASDVWIGDVDYLQAVIDPYSLHQPHSKWYDTIYFDDWETYLLEKGMESVRKIPDELLYIQQRHRKKHFVLDEDTLLITQIRKDWDFRSTFFNMFPEEDNKIVIWGKGYGHGVGMSQEGAMKMARDGFSYKDIIKFYFYNVRIMNYEDLPLSSLPDMDYESME